MTAEELFSDLYDKYGEDFNWMMISFSDHTFVDELKKELGNNNSFEEIYSVAKCESKDDVLFLVDGIYRIYHLTYSADNIPGFPKYTEFADLISAVKFIENDFICDL